MKIRNGFVSNSSSSSFLLIGVKNESIIKQLWEAEFPDKKETKETDDVEEGRYHFSHGQYSGELITFCGSEYDYCYDAGVEAKSLLETMALPEARKHFQELIKKKFKIDIPVENIDILYGEASDGS